MSERLLKESNVLKIACQLPYVVNSAFFDAVKALPSADRLQEWIPCSERLPEESGSYLTWSAIGFIPDHVDEPNTYEGVTIACFSKDFCDWFGAEKVYAWMPLPKPWKGASDD